MKIFSQYTLAAFTLGNILLGASGTAQAQVPGLSFQFTPPVETVGIGGSADYTGSFDNTTTTAYEVTLGDYSPDPATGSPLVTGFFDGDPSNNNAPFEVAAGQTVTVRGVFTLSADPSLGSGTYTGIVDFQGQTFADFQAGTGTDSTLASAPVTLIVQGTAPVPEASTAVSFGLLLMLGMGGLVAGARRRRVGSRL